MMSSMMGAIAFQKGLGATHSLAHPLSTEFGMHHGTTNAVLLPVVLQFNRSVSADRLKDLAAQFGGSDAIERVHELNRVLGIKPRLRDHGITEESLPMLADKAFELYPAVTGFDLRYWYTSRIWLELNHASTD